MPQYTQVHVLVLIRAEPSPGPSQVSVACSWDSSIHNSVHLNRITSPNERIYLITKVTLQLSHPASMELVVRKRIAVNIYNKQVGARRSTPQRALAVVLGLV